VTDSIFGTVSSDTQTSPSGSTSVSSSTSGYSLQPGLTTGPRP
jgi:hypothetical protein